MPIYKGRMRLGRRKLRWKMRKNKKNTLTLEKVFSIIRFALFVQNRIKFHRVIICGRIQNQEKYSRG